VLLPFEYQLLSDALAVFQRACGGPRHLLPIGGDHPPILFSQLIVAPVDRIHRVRFDELKRHGIVAGVLEIVRFAVKSGSITEVARKVDPIDSVGLDPEHQPLPQTSLAEILRPLAGKSVTVGLIAPAPRPDGDSVGMTDARNRGRQLVPVTGKLLPNRRQDSSILHFLDLGLALVDLAQLHLIECWIGRNGHRVPVRFHREFEVCFARHDDMHSIELRCDGEFIRRIQSRLRRHKRPGANARILRFKIRFSSKWNDENECEQRECADGSS
jgi:hypothetical protein